MKWMHWSLVLVGALGSWAAADEKVKLKIDWKALGLDPSAIDGRY